MKRKNNMKSTKGLVISLNGSQDELASIIESDVSENKGCLGYYDTRARYFKEFEKEMPINHNQQGFVPSLEDMDLQFRKIPRKGR